MLKIAILITSLLSFCAPSFAENSSVFGIPLGAAFSMRECPKSGRNYVLRSDFLCFEYIGSTVGHGDAVENDSVMIQFPSGSSPSIVRGWSMMGGVINGKLESVGFNTRGIHNQEYVFAALKEKYGEPTRVKKFVAKNGAGAVFDAFDIGWSKDDVEVRFQSVTGTFDVGLVNVDTKKGLADREKALRALSKDDRPI